MVKLILSDMDGTLARSDKSLPEKANEVFEQLLDRGYYVGIATGRSLASVQRDFPKFKDRFTVIAENGSVLFHQGKMLYTSNMDKTILKDIVTQILQLEGVVPLFACGMVTYGLNQFKNLGHIFDVYYPNMLWVNAFEDIQDDIVKMATYFENYNAKDFTETFEPFRKYCDVTISAVEWTDFSNHGINKGFGVKKLTELLHLDTSEVMAFGDYLNDYEMLKVAKESYAMENAHPEVKKVAKYVIGTNDEEAVIQTLETLLNTHNKDSLTQK